MSTLVSTRQARQGQTLDRMRYVLAGSTALAAASLSIAYVSV